MPFPTRKPAPSIEAELRRLVDSGQTPGLQYAAVSAASVVCGFSAGYAELASRTAMSPSTTLMAYSMSKTITAVAVLKLVESGLVGLDDPVSMYLEWQPYGGEITVRQLLSHTSGIPNPIPLRWVHSAAEHRTFDERAALTEVLHRHSKLVFPPGSKFAYSNVGYWLLGFIVEKSSGESFVNYVQRNIFAPLEIDLAEMAYTVTAPSNHAAGYLEKVSAMNLVKRFLIDGSLIGKYSGAWLRILDHYANGAAFGGIVGTAHGFAKFLQDQLQDRSRLLSAETRNLLMQPKSATAGSIPMTLGWHCGGTPNTPVLFKEGGGGGFHCLMRLYPSEGLGTVLMTNATGINVRAALDLVDSNLLRSGH